MPVVPKKKRGPRALGITCGIGSMLVGARQAGFDVMGNIEWRQYYHKTDAEGRNTFKENFPEAFFISHYEEIGDDVALNHAVSHIDLVLGHPECGNFSTLGGVNKGYKEKRADPCDIPLFIDLIAAIKPRFFVMDDLPKSFGAYPISEYAAKLPEYDLFPEWVSNYGYGNAQKHRNRMFMIGSLKKEKWAFWPREEDVDITLKETIQDLMGREGQVPNHEHTDREANAQKNLSMRYIGDHPSWTEMCEFARTNWKEGESMTYFANDGTIKRKPGCKVERWEGPASVQDGGSYKIHPVEYRSLTLRERARIQGFPDDFIFYGTKLNDRGEYNPDKNNMMTKQTGKAMPIQFCEFVSSQVFNFMLGILPDWKPTRILKPNMEISKEKKWYCQNIGYENQQGACSACWMKSNCTIRRDKYGIILDSDQTGEDMEQLQTFHGLEGEPPVTKRVPFRRVEAEAPPGRKPLRRVEIELPPKKVVPEVKKEFFEVAFSFQSAPPEVVEKVHLFPKVIPSDYFCRCELCTHSIGELRRPDKTYYSRNDRRKYYSPEESFFDGHVKRVHHYLNRWAVQHYTKPGDWVLDPIMGVGTSLVESAIQARNFLGMSGGGHTQAILDSSRVNMPRGVRAIFGVSSNLMDIGELLGKTKEIVSLIITSPDYKYPPEKLGDLYNKAVTKLRRGGRFVLGVKDEVTNDGVPNLLHVKFSDVLAQIGLTHEGTAFLKHYPTAKQMKTYYQTITVFRKD